MKEQTVDDLLRIAMTHKSIEGFGIHNPKGYKYYKKAEIDDIDVKNNIVKITLKDEAPHQYSVNLIYGLNIVSVDGV